MRKTVSLLVALFVACTMYAELKLPAIFGDNMLLRQNSEVKIWGWADGGRTVIVSPSWTQKQYTARADHSGKWTVAIQTPAASYQTYSLTVSDNLDTLAFGNILVGEVWLCSGQSNMEMPMKGFMNQPVSGGNEAIFKSGNKNIRLITVKRASSLAPETGITGEWQEATPEVVGNFSATGYYYGRLLQEMLDVPVGLILSAWGGSWVESWMSKEMLDGFSEVKLPGTEEDIKEKSRTPTTLFNGMISPIAGYTISGCIWYQGESNYDRAAQYPALFQRMVSGWRNLWGQGDFPFYYCQIAPYANPPEKHGVFNGAFLREAQYKSARTIPHSGMVVLMDIGEERCIHPADKKTGGERLAMLALAKTYGMAGYACESPVFKEMTIEDGKAVLSFDNAPMWLTSFGKELKEFEIAGADRVFHPAKAQIRRSVVEVSSDKVPVPAAVRYAFRGFATGDLFSTEGLPLSSFRTDDWDE